MLDGERNWTLPNLEKLAKKLNVPLNYFLAEHGEVPVVREIVAQESFKFPAKPQEEPVINWVTVPKLEVTLLAQMYGIRIKDGSYLPDYKKGTTFIAQKKTSENIEGGDIVVYSSPNGNGHLGKVYFHNDKILFKPLNPLDRKELLLDQGQLTMMDKVLYIQLY